ncbi:MAG: transposase [Gammaproteobacteria bacterium]|nr:transposase [Gammaproteobacteria bacterium]
MKEFNAMALFRLSVLGPLVSADHLQRGELQQTIRKLAQKEYAIPGSNRRFLGEKTIEAWYYAWRRHGIEGLTPKVRTDQGVSKLSADIQNALLAAKRENPRRSIRQLKALLECAGLAPRGTLSRSAIHRFLQQQGLSRPTGAASVPQEHRRFVTEWANSLWYGDVMHGPSLTLKSGRHKVYLVSLLDDASRLITHSAFCLGETALDIEGVLKQAVLKRGLPKKLVVDNGPAYRAATLQGICARLDIRLIYCRPYAPEGKGKLERWHRTFRDQFLSEVDLSRIQELDDLNARLWAWIEQVYHRTPHGGLDDITPLARYQQDLLKIRQLGQKAAQLDAIFYHRVQRKVRKDGTVSYAGNDFEVPYALSGKTVQLVVDPHAERVVGVEDEDGKHLGAATPLDALANAQRRRRKPEPATPAAALPAQGPNRVELAFEQHYAHTIKEND